jgi:hypothetical protein
MLASLAKNGVKEQELTELFRRFVADPDQWLAEKMRHQLWCFCTQGGLNKYRTRARTAGMSEREIRGAQAAEAFVASGGGGSNARR